MTFSVYGRMSLDATTLSGVKIGLTTEEALILIFGREDIRKFREVLQQAEQILDDRKKLKQIKGEHNGKSLRVHH